MEDVQQVAGSERVSASTDLQTIGKQKLKSNRGDSKEERAKEKEMYDFMRNFRETFSRPVKRLRFLGLFDTVNSVPRFESAWMQRSKFPYTAHTSAKVIRHAVSINERRAKFRQDLVSARKNSKLAKQDRNTEEMEQTYYQAVPQKQVNGSAKKTAAVPQINVDDVDKDRPARAGPSKAKSGDTLGEYLLLHFGSGGCDIHDSIPAYG